jgi:ATP-dependent exoDNAse (exonuclease V) alpha subunit
MKQQEALEILKMGQNIFLTGPAGSGKTYLLNKYISYLEDNKISVAITASTGIAATHLNGRTIHSWCGMRIEEKMDEKQIDSLKDNENIFYRVISAKVLIIDEVSMLNASRLDLVNNICQALRQDLRPFGGLQVILCGDFFQLPPVTTKKSEDGRFIVESESWNNMNLKICYLEDQYRQDDKKFLSVLNSIRDNTVDKNIVAILMERLNQSINFNIKPTKLHTHNKNVDAENLFELNKLEGEERFYQMTSSGVPHLIKSLKENCLAPEDLHLKIDAVVMFVKNNFGQHYVNGTLGKVISFDKDTDYPLVQTVSGRQIIACPEAWTIEEGHRVLASISQIPLRLAWAITVHKSQGMSLDCAEIDLSNTFEFGMGYVALSRVRSLEGIKLLGINDKALQVNQSSIDLDKILFDKSQHDLESYKNLGSRLIRRTQKDFIKNNKEEEKTGYFLGLPF